MSHTWEDYTVKLLDKDRAELGSLVNVHNLKGSQTEFGDYGSLLTFSININDTKASHFVEQQRHFVQVLRDGTKIFDGFTVKTARRYATTTQGLAEFIEVTCMPLSQVVGWRHGQPVTVPTLISSGRTADDGFKWLLERTHGATAPNSPTNATNRTLAGFTLEADESARAGNVTIDATGKNMYDLLLRMGARYKVDWWVEFDASWNMEFKTAYPRRGLDRTEGNGARTEVIFNDSADTVRSVNYGYDAGGAIDAVMNKPMTVDAENATMQANWLYMETVIDTEDTEELEAELARRAVVEFYKSDFVERADLVWDPSDSVTGPHFGIGDEITYVNKRLGYGPHNAVICKIEFEILANGEEKLTLTFGDPIPDIFDKQKNKRRSQAADDYTFLSYWRRDGTNQILYPTYSVSGAPDHVATTWGGDIRAYSDERTTLKFDVDGATGNTAWADAAQMTWESMAYRMPVDAPATGEALMVTTGTPNQLQWALPKPDAHDILSAYHGDTLAAGVVDGDVIIGNATPAWSRLAIAIPAAGTRNVLGIDNAELRPSWKTAVYSVALTLPGEFSVAGSPITGTGTLAGTWVNQAANLVFSGPAAGAPAVPTFRALVAADIVGISDPGTCTVATGNAVGPPHTHAITTSSNPGAAASILASSAAGLLQLVGLGIGAAAVAGGIVVLNGGWIGIGAALERIVFDAAGDIAVMGANLGVGTLAPTYRLDIVAGAGGEVWRGTRGTSLIAVYQAVNAAGYLGMTSNDNLHIITNDAVRITALAGGDVGIGTQTPDSIGGAITTLDIEGANGGGVRIGIDAGTDAMFAATATAVYVSAITAHPLLFSTTNTERMRLPAAGNLELRSANDFLVYSDAAVTLKASIDGATGNISVGWGGANAQVFFVDANTYISAAVVFGLVTDLPLIVFSPGGGGSEVECGVGYLEPTGNNVTTAGRAASRWSNVYSVLGNFTGTITASQGGTAIASSGDITMIAGKTVDGVDISEHTHAISGATGGATPNLTGETTGWLIDGAADYTAGHNSVRQVGGTVVYMTADGHLSTTAAGNTELLVGSSGHHHDLVGTSGGVTTNLATAIVDNHTHAAGTLVTAAP